MAVNSWTPEKCTTLKMWQHSCKVYGWAHGEAQELYDNYFNRMNICSIILTMISAILGTVSAAMSAEQNGSRSAGLSIVTAVASATAAIIGCWMQSSKPNEIAAQHEQTVKGYQRIVLAIDAELTLGEVERTNGDEFMRNIRDQLMEISVGGRIVPKSIWNRAVQINDDLDSILSGHAPSDTVIPIGQHSRSAGITIAPILPSVSPVPAASSIPAASVSTVPPVPDSPATPSNPLTPTDALTPIEANANMPGFELNYAASQTAIQMAKKLMQFNYSRFN